MLSVVDTLPAEAATSAKAKPSDDPRAKAARLKRLYARADVQEILAAKDAELEQAKQAAIEKPEELKQAQAKVMELEHQQRMSAMTINHLTELVALGAKHVEELKRRHAMQEKEDKEFREYVGSTLDRAIEQLKQAELAKGRAYTGRKRGRPSKQTPTSLDSENLDPKLRWKIKSRINFE